MVVEDFLGLNNCLDLSATQTIGQVLILQSGTSCRMQMQHFGACVILMNPHVSLSSTQIPAELQGNLASVSNLVQDQRVNLPGNDRVGN